MKEPKLTFTKDAIPFLLSALKMTTDSKGYVIDAKSKEFVLDFDGNKFKSGKLIGIVGKQFITNSCQIIDLVDKGEL